jgi:hypothetical protein
MRPRYFRTKAPYALACLLPLVASASATAAAESLLEMQIQAVMGEGGALAQQRHQLEAAQQKLLSQKQDMDAAGRQLAQRQTDVNQQISGQNQQVSEQQQRLQKSRAECNHDTTSGSQSQLSSCNDSIQSLNKKTQDIDQDKLLLQDQQDSLLVDYALYDLGVIQWNYDEQDTVIQLNLIYLGTNDWLDRAYALMTSDGFQTAINATHNNTYCSGDAIPEGHVTQKQLGQAADYLLSCFRRVDKARRLSAAH